MLVFISLSIKKAPPHLKVSAMRDLRDLNIYFLHFTLFEEATEKLFSNLFIRFT